MGLVTEVRNSRFLNGGHEQAERAKVSDVIGNSSRNTLSANAGRSQKHNNGRH
jgi:hypothetical protein